MAEKGAFRAVVLDVPAPVSTARGVSNAAAVWVEAIRPCSARNPLCSDLNPICGGACQPATMATATGCNFDK